ncbi:secreted protein [Bathymodiolus azoricus thioautotrophic gill symbiont]|uniref:Secreted protein n=1 Tax=Bathymodiolus azoricus thioautotrophic gill symbiont TaxID=235205 RepID=A0A1H6N581_9GAMM|nr:secreted protein [Bathymodiolus azoricus thioautotrophic gill symbiont]
MFSSEVSVCSVAALPSCCSTGVSVSVCALEMSAEEVPCCAAFSGCKGLGVLGGFSLLLLPRPLNPPSVTGMILPFSLTSIGPM